MDQTTDTRSLIWWMDADTKYRFCRWYVEK